MYACAHCGSWLWKKEIFCKNCQPKINQVYHRKTKDYQHYYFFPWNKKTKGLILSQKQGLHQSWLQKNHLNLQKLLPKEVVSSKQNVFVAPSSKHLAKDKNHAYLLAKYLGFTNPLDVFARSNKQSLLNKKERIQNSLRLKSKYKRPLKDVIIVDDVLTTGATVRMMQKALGAEHLTVITLAYVKPSL